MERTIKKDRACFGVRDKGRIKDMLFESVATRGKLREGIANKAKPRTREEAASGKKEKKANKKKRKIQTNT